MGLLNFSNISNIKINTAKASYNWSSNQYSNNMPSLFNYSYYPNYFKFYNTTNFSQYLDNLKVPSFKFTTSTAYKKTAVRLTGNMGKDIVSTAKQYIGFNESDGSYKKFTGGRNEAWCADFVSYVIKEAYRKNGKNAPSGFGSPAVSDLRSWAENNNCYLKTSGKSNKATIIANNVKSGDIVIFKNGRSHTGVVDKVFADGSFTTIEGNTSNKVASRKYSPNEATLSGFVQIA